MVKFNSTISYVNGIGKAVLPRDLFKYIKGFTVVEMGEDQDHVLTVPENTEAGLLILEGRCDVSINGVEHKGLGERDSVFQGLPTAVYAPSDTDILIKSNGVKVAFCCGKCSKKYEPGVIRPGDVKKMTVGKDNWSREVRLIIGPDFPSENLILGETINPAGNWSGTPAHRHEKNAVPLESLHEELYYFRTGRPQGFGIQRQYSPERDIDELIMLGHDTVTFMPWGYHQIVAGPGYDLYYLFFLSGEGKQLVGVPDPDHKWLLG